MKSPSSISSIDNTCILVFEGTIADAVAFIHAQASSLQWRSQWTYCELPDNRCKATCEEPVVIHLSYANQ